MNYLLLKHVHMSLAAASGALFLLRGCWMLTQSPRLQRPWVGKLPHAIDSLLLASALGLAFWSHQGPANSPWLAAKIIALLAYIVLGSIALKYGKSLRQRAAAFFTAVGCFGYIVAAAITKNPFLFF